MVRGAFALFPGTCIKLLWYREVWVASSDLYSSYSVMWVTTQLQAFFPSKEEEEVVLKWIWLKINVGASASSAMWISLKWISCVFLYCSATVNSQTDRKRLAALNIPHGWPEISVFIICHDISIWKDKLWLIELVLIAESYDLWFQRSEIHLPEQISLPGGWTSAARLEEACKHSGKVCVSVCVGKTCQSQPRFMSLWIAFNYGTHSDSLARLTLSLSLSVYLSLSRTLTNSLIDASQWKQYVVALTCVYEFLYIFPFLSVSLNLRHCVQSETGLLFFNWTWSDIS